MTTLYETDLVEWAEQQVQLLRAEDFEKVDWNNVIEEIESLGATQKRELRNRLTILLMHLLKWQFQPDRRSRSWKITIDNQRIDIEVVLKDNPSLRPHFSEFVANAYPIAIEKAATETELPIDTFPTECPYSLEQIRSKGYFPE